MVEPATINRVHPEDCQWASCSASSVLLFQVIGIERIARREANVSSLSHIELGLKASMGPLQFGHDGREINENRTRRGSSRSAVVPTVLRLFRDRSERVMARVGGR